MEERTTGIYVPGALAAVFALGASLPFVKVAKGALSPEFQSVISPEVVNLGAGAALVAGGAYALYKVVHAGYRLGGFAGGFFMPPLTVGALAAGMQVGVAIDDQFFDGRGPVLDLPTDLSEAGNYTKQPFEPRTLPSGHKITFGYN